ncbi:MAG: hypothetical protein ABSA66_15890 [Roseiarcus sp.]|jgi:hypothetical protein
MSNMTVKVLLKLVDQLTAPARAAVKELSGLKDVAAPSPGAWIDQGKAIANASQAALDYKLASGEAIGFASTIKPEGWVKQQEEIDKATGKVEDYKSGISGATGLINNATQAILGFVAAHAGLELASKAISAGADAAHLHVGMEVAGMSPAEIAETEAKSAEWSKKYPMLSQTEIEGIILDTRSIVGTTKEALDVAPKELGYMIADRMAHPGEPGSAGAVLKAAEVMGITQDEAKLGKFFDMAAQAVSVFARTLRGEDIREFALRSGSQYASKMDLDYFFGPALTAAQEMGGDTAGFSQRMTLQELFGAHLSGREVKALDDLGLIDSSKVTRRDKEGHPTEIDPGGIRGTDLALTNLYQWVQTVLKPAMSKLSPTEAAEKVATIFANRGSNLVSIYSQQQARIEKDVVLRKGAMGADAADVWVAKDPEAAGQALGGQIWNWLRSAGTPFMPGLRGDAEALRRTTTAEVEATRGHDWVNALLAGATAAGGAALGLATFTNGVTWLVKGVTGLVIAGAVKEAADIADPKGNFWGLTSPIDEFAKRHFGFDPSNVFGDATPYNPSLDPNSTENRLAAARGLRHAGYLPGEAQSESEREASRARALSPGVDASQIDAAAAKAKEARGDLDALGATVAPKVDSSALDALLAKLREALALVGSINGGIGGASRRASFAGMLHDGPETR